VQWFRDLRGPPLYSGLGDCPNNLISFLSRAPKRCLPRIYEGIPLVDCSLALNCSSRTCGDEFPMNSTKQLHVFPRVRGRRILRTPDSGAGIAPVEVHPIGAGLLFTSWDLYAPPQHVVPSHAAWVASEAILASLGGRSMHDPASELRRIPLLRLYEKWSSDGISLL
jgi:hypothetical protein